MGDEVWIYEDHVEKIFRENESYHLIVARYHGQGVAERVIVESEDHGVILDSRFRLWKRTSVHEGDLQRFVRVMAKPMMITVYEVL